MYRADETISGSGARRAALALHSLPEEGRQKVLQRLSDDERAKLHLLLEELVALGIPRELPIETLPISNRSAADKGALISDFGDELRVFGVQSSGTAKHLFSVIPQQLRSVLTVNFPKYASDAMADARAADAKLPHRYAQALLKAYSREVSVLPSAKTTIENHIPKIGAPIRIQGVLREALRVMRFPWKR